MGWGASGRNGGQMIIGFPCGMQRLKGAMGQERAKRMFDASREAVADIRGIAACDNYSEVMLGDGSKILLRKTLKAWEDALGVEAGPVEAEDPVETCAPVAELFTGAGGSAAKNSEHTSLTSAKEVRSTM